ncbi:unnamed protein product [Camellia sinensis]
MEIEPVWQSCHCHWSQNYKWWKLHVHGSSKGQKYEGEHSTQFLGCPLPPGIYRKATRMMYYADHHGFPIVTFIDTPGAFADLK